LATKSHTVVCSLLSPPWWDKEKNLKEKAKLTGCDKKQFNRTAKGEEINNNNTDKKNIQHAMFSQPNAQLAPEQQIHFLCPTPHLNTEHDIIWYRISHLIGWFGSAQPASSEN